MSAPDAVVLTRLTRRGNEDRRVVIQGFDVGYRTFIMLVASSIPGLIAGVITFAFLRGVVIFGQSLGIFLGVTMTLLVGGTVYGVLSAKTRAGLSYYKSLKDWRRERSRLGVIHLGIEPIPPYEAGTIAVMHRGAIPVREVGRERLPDFWSAGQR